MTERVIVLKFNYESLSYQAFSEIKNKHHRVSLKGKRMAIISNHPQAKYQFVMEDYIDFTNQKYRSRYSFLGMLAGAFIHPVVMLLGWFVGSELGRRKESQELLQARSIFDYMSREIPEEETAVILIAEEEDNRPLNQLVFQKLGGHITRFDLEDIQAEVQVVDELQKKLFESLKKNTKNKKEKSE